MFLAQRDLIFEGNIPFSNLNIRTGTVDQSYSYCPSTTYLANTGCPPPSEKKPTAFWKPSEASVPRSCRSTFSSNRSSPEVIPFLKSQVKRS